MFEEKHWKTFHTTWTKANIDMMIRYKLLQAHAFKASKFTSILHQQSFQKCVERNSPKYYLCNFKTFDIQESKLFTTFLLSISLVFWYIWIQEFQFNVIEKYFCETWFTRIIEGFHRYSCQSNLGQGVPRIWGNSVWSTTWFSAPVLGQTLAWCMAECMMLHDRLGSNITYLYAEHTAPPSLFSTHNGAKTEP